MPGHDLARWERETEERIEYLRGELQREFLQLAFQRVAPEFCARVADAIEADPSHILLMRDAEENPST
jgi:hypothetical protein